MNLTNRLSKIELALNSQTCSTIRLDMMLGEAERQMANLINAIGGIPADIKVLHQLEQIRFLNLIHGLAKFGYTEDAAKEFATNFVKNELYKNQQMVRKGTKYGKL